MQNEATLLTTEVEIIALDHSCRELFLIMYMKNLLGEAIITAIGDTSTGAYNYEDNTEALIYIHLD